MSVFDRAIDSFLDNNGDNWSNVLFISTFVEETS